MIPAGRARTPETGAVAREMGRSMVLLAVAGSSVGCAVGVIGVATRLLAR